MQRDKPGAGAAPLGARRARLVAAVVVALAGSTATAQEASPGLASTITTLASQVAPGQRPASKLFGAFGPHRTGVSFLLGLTAGSCYTLVGAAGPGVADVDMYLFDPAGHRVAADRRDEAWTQIIHCATFSGQYRVELKVKDGEGEVGFRAYQAGASRPGGEPDDAPEAPRPAARPARDAAVRDDPRHPLARPLAAAAAALAPGARLMAPPLAGLIDEDHPADLTLLLEAGRCYTIVSVAAPSVRKLYTYLWSPGDGKRVATDRAGSGTSRLSLCTTIPGPYHFQAKADEGAGEFRTGAYSR